MEESDDEVFSEWGTAGTRTNGSVLDFVANELFSASTPGRSPLLGTGGEEIRLSASLNVTRVPNKKGAEIVLEEVTKENKNEDGEEEAEEGSEQNVVAEDDAGVGLEELKEQMGDQPWMQVVVKQLGGMDTEEEGGDNNIPPVKLVVTQEGGGSEEVEEAAPKEKSPRKKVSREVSSLLEEAREARRNTPEGTKSAELQHTNSKQQLLQPPTQQQQQPARKRGVFAFFRRSRGPPNPANEVLDLTPVSCRHQSMITK